MAKSARGETSREREDDTIIRHLVAVRRVAAGATGGRRFSFSALVVTGDGKGRVGYGSGKAREVSDAVKKATFKANSSMTRVPLMQGRTLHTDCSAKFGAARVHLRAAPQGTGIIAGSSMRAVFLALGVQDVVAKALTRSSPFNQIAATLKALKGILPPRVVAQRRDRSLNDVLGIERKRISGK